MSAQQKEDRLFENIYLSYFPKMKRFAQEYVISEQDAENIVQDMFAELWEKREMFTCQTIRIAYLFTIIKNKCLNHLRAQAVRLRAHGEMEELQQRVLRESIRSLEMCDPERLFEGEVERIVRDCLDEMPELTRSVFTEQRLRGRSYREVAAQYGISERRVETELGKALGKLRLALRDYLPAALAAAVLERLTRQF